MSSKPSKHATYSNHDLERIPAMLERAMAFHRSGNTTGARTLYQKILKRNPDNLDALHLLAVVTAQCGEPAKGVRLLDRAIQLDPANAAMHCNRGVLLRTLQQLDAALASLDTAIALHAEYAEAHLYRGMVLRELLQPAAALASYDRAIAILPTYAEAHFNRGNLLREQGQPAGAASSYDHAIALQPGYADAHLFRALVLQELKQWDAALRSCDQAIALRPDWAEAHLFRGNVLRELMQLDAALASYGKALGVRSDFAEALLNRGTIFRELMQEEAALQCYQQAVTIRPDYTEAHASIAATRLLLGDFDGGWRELEWRWSNSDGSNIGQRRYSAHQLWLGDEPLAGKTILLYWEQGLGDTLQFCRYAPLVAGLGARVLLEVQQPLRSVLANLPGVSQLVASGSELPQFDLNCPLMSLPLAFKTRVETIPASPSYYLHADAERVAHWESRLGVRVKPRIGLVWSGNPEHAHDRRRSISLETMISGFPAHFEYVSLQKEVREADARTLQAHPEIRDFSADLGDFADTAALCKCLDLVISVDTSVAHLSGALGQVTWILLPIHPDWRWLKDRSDSPWYPSARLFRQTRMGEWDDVLAGVAAELTECFGTK